MNKYRYIQRKSDNAIFAAQFAGDDLVSVVGPVPDWQTDSDPKGYDWREDSKYPDEVGLDDPSAWIDYTPVPQP